MQVLLRKCIVKIQTSIFQMSAFLLKLDNFSENVDLSESTFVIGSSFRNIEFLVLFIIGQGLWVCIVCKIIWRFW